MRSSSTSRTRSAPVDDYSGEEGQLVYLDALGRRRRYRYRKGTGLAFGAGFVHGTAHCRDLPRVFLCFTFGTDDASGWEDVRASIHTQSRLYRRPDGSFQFTADPGSAG